MDKLSKEEVLHVADLAKLELKEDEIDRYAVKLKQILNEIEKINEIEIDDKEILIAPNVKDLELKENDSIEQIPSSEALKNAPKTYESYIEIRGVFND